MFAAKNIRREGPGKKSRRIENRRQEALSDDFFLPFAGDPFGAVRFLRAKFVIVFALCFRFVM